MKNSTKRVGDKLEFDKSKKQKTDENEEVEVDNEAELKEHMVIVKDDDIAIDAITTCYQTTSEFGIDSEDLAELSGKFVKTKCTAGTKVYAVGLQLLEELLLSEG
ncbi:hypothetical protein Tco_0629492 [Tanacetum coccineum]|uniref:Uncharacterized protein n=1 Tax=Tanacetum coccineum TaxID=301880 RepID=A0ABQ4WTH8_9ASTR